MRATLLKADDSPSILQYVLAAAAAYASVAKTQHTVYKILGIFQKYTYPKEDWYIEVHMNMEWEIRVIIMTVTEVEIAIGGELCAKDQKTSIKSSVVLQN